MARRRAFRQTRPRTVDERLEPCKLMLDFRSNPTALVVAALAAGLTLGILISVSGDRALLSIATRVEPIGILWINAIRMTVIPLVVSLLFVSMTGFSDIRSAGRIGGSALMIFVAFLAGAAVFAALTVPALFNWMPMETTGAALSQAPAAADVQQRAQQLPSFAEWLVDLVPTNPLRAAADGAMLPLVIFSILFGLASTAIAPDLRELLVRFFRAVSESMLVLVRWLILLAPVGVFALVLPLAARTGASTIGAFAYYLVVTSAVLCVLTLAAYPVAALLGGVPARRFAEAVLPAQIIAFSSRSSLASLPALLEGAEKKLQFPPQVMQFALTLAVSIFKFNTPVVWLAGACFVGRLYGVPLGPAEIGLILVGSVILSFGAPGIPMGSLVLLAPVFASAGLPVEGIGVLIAIDLIPDVFKTISNVTGDMATAVILSRKHIARSAAQLVPETRPT